MNLDQLVHIFEELFSDNLPPDNIAVKHFIR